MSSDQAGGAVGVCCGDVDTYYAWRESGVAASALGLIIIIIVTVRSELSGRTSTAIRIIPIILEILYFPSIYD